MSLRLGKETRKSLRRSDPEPAIARAKGRGNLSAGQPVGGCVVPNAACGRIELIETLPRAKVEASVKVFGNCEDHIARQSLRRCITRKRRALCSGVIKTKQPASRRSQPDSAVSVSINIHHSPGRCAFSWLEKLKRSFMEKREAGIEPNPNVTRRIFTERPREVVVKRG